MTTSLPTSLPIWLAGCTYDDTGGDDLRNGNITPFFYDVGASGGDTIGVLGGVTGGTGLVVTADGGMSLSVSPGSFVVPNTASPASGGYAATLAESGTLTLAAANGSNPRIDIVCAGVTDNGDSTSSGWVQVITGTASSSPTIPAAPANSIIVATIEVPAAATTVTSGDITGNENFTTTAGGVLVCQRASPPLGYYGQVGYDWPTGTHFHNSGGGALPLRTLLFAPVTAILSGDGYTLTTTSAQIPGLTATVEVDGVTDLKVTYNIAGFTGIASETCVITVGVYIDGVLVDEKVSPVLAASTSAQAGMSGIAFTSSVTDNTLSEGEHTVTVQAWSSAVSGSSPQVHPFSGLPAPAWVRVEPVNL